MEELLALLHAPMPLGIALDEAGEARRQQAAAAGSEPEAEGEALSTLLDRHLPGRANYAGESYEAGQAVYAALRRVEELCLDGREGEMGGPCATLRLGTLVAIIMDWAVEVLGCARVLNQGWAPEGDEEELYKLKTLRDELDGFVRKAEEVEWEAVQAHYWAQVQPWTT